MRMTPGNASESMETMLVEPYDRFACNELRKECYRRKLRVVKSGPYMNATKAGFLQLLRADDDATCKTIASAEDKRLYGCTQAPESERDAVVRAVALDYIARAVHVVTPPMSPGVVRHLPADKERDVVADPTTTIVNALTSEEDVDAMSTISESASSARESAPLAFSRSPSAVAASGYRAACLKDRAVLPPLRWERLYSRLEMIDAKLVALYQLQHHSNLQTSNSSQIDIAFYEQLKHHLKRQLVESAELNC